MIYKITCFILRVLCRLLFSIKLYGLKNIPQKGSFIMASNHVSYLDPVIVGAFVPRELNYIARRSLFKNKFFGWYLKKIRAIPMDRSALAYSGMKEVIKRIRKGEPVVIFPEGTRSNGSFFLEPERGAAYLALKFNLPVVPVYVKGAAKALPKNARFIRLKPIRGYYGEPKRYEMPDKGDRDEIYKKVSYKIMEEIKKLKNRYG